MKTILIALLTMITSLSIAQDNYVKDDFKPSTLNQPGREYPQVNSLGYARFRIHSPAADSVGLALHLF